MYSKLEAFILDAANGTSVNEEQFEEVTQLFGSDLDKSLLKSQSQNLQAQFSEAENYKPV